MRLHLFPLLSTLLLTSCTCNKPEGAVIDPQNDMSGTQTGEGTQEGQAAAGRKSDPRDAWVQTDVLFETAGGVGGRTVADLFAGDGYLTFKLIEAGANVIAIDTDINALAAIETTRKERGIDESRLRTRLVRPEVPGLAPGEADMAFCLHRYTTIANRGRFFQEVRTGLKPPAPVIIIDFLRTQTPVGPPIEQRVNENQVMDELEPSGFTDIGVYTQKIPYQYVVVAQDFVPGQGEQ